MSDRIISICAIVSALAAVAVAAYEARINREYQRISVWPRIQQSNSWLPDQPYVRTVSNAGIGPALVRSVQISVDNVPRRNWGEVIQALIKKPAPGHVYSSLHAGAVVLAGKELAVLKIPPGDEARQFWEQAKTQRFAVRICYSSLYGECWQADNLTDQPNPVGDCRSDPAKDFEQ